MYVFIIGLIIFVCLLLVLVVLSQHTKDRGLSGTFGGPGSTQLFGVKKTGDLLENITWGLAIALIVLILSTNLPGIIDRPEEEDEGVGSVNVERAQESPISPPPNQQQNNQQSPDGAAEKKEENKLEN
ncbi:MAG: preprotein translocase subunit SecG [Cytophagales bacterium]|nr:preprotein translocase subunit SecG [Cytophagales bacterium]